VARLIKTRLMDGTMSEYLKQLKVQLVGKVPGVRFHDISPLELSIAREGFPEVRIRDEKDHVVVRIENQVYKYDKWYTKPEHLAETLKVYYMKQSSA
ncbi:MAG: hypothetical protein QXO87_06950, partial [Desulfurococcaceae archaeon]